jgi:ATP-dependent Clp protease ATP-binding subunit ClpA
MFERFTQQSRDVVVRATEEAELLRHPLVGTEHLLLALVDEETGVAHTVLHRAGLDRPKVRAEIERLLAAPATRIFDAQDAEALKSVGIDLDAVLARIEESFGPEALASVPPASRRGFLRGRPRYGPGAKKVLELALREAIRLRSRRIGTEHILLGVLREGKGLATRILVDAGVTLDELRRQTMTELGRAA